MPKASPPEDEDELVDALVAAASDREQRLARGRRAQAESRRCGWTGIAQRFASLHEELLVSAPRNEIARTQRD